MTRTHASAGSTMLLMTMISLSVAGCSSSKPEPAGTQDNDASVATGNAAQESASTASKITISNAAPGSANGEYGLAAVGRVPSSGDSTMYQAIGRSGPMEHSVLLTFNAAGALETVLWSRSSDDGTVKINIQCDNDKGSPAPCSAGHFKADAKTGAVTFDQLTLKGMDQSGEPASATITGTVR